MELLPDEMPRLPLKATAGFYPSFKLRIAGGLRTGDLSLPAGLRALGIKGIGENRGTDGKEHRIADL